MRTKKTLSQRAQRSTGHPRSWMSGLSQRAACGWRFGSKAAKANAAPSQIAARLQRKIASASPARRSLTL
jgi:hypothetical protein